MKAAQRDEIVELGLATVRPVLDVVPIAEARAVAAGKAAATVPGAQRSFDRQRDRARLAADVERVAVLAFDDADDRSVTSETSRRVERERRAVLHLAAMRATLGGGLLLAEDRLVDVHDDLHTVGGRSTAAGLAVMREESFRHEP